MYLNIRDFGAAGDGRTDDTAALTAAMDAAAKENGTVYFPAGNYRIRPVRVPGHITLLGNSAWGYGNRKDENGGLRDPQTMGNTVISAACGGAPALFDMDGVCGTRMIGLTLDGQNLGECMHGVYSRHRGTEQNICFEDCRITSFTGSGLKLDWVWVFAVRRCLIAGNGQYGIDLDRGYDGWVIDNQITGNRLYGVNAGPGMVCYTGNRIEWNRGGGIYCENTRNINVTGNSFDHNFGPAVCFRNSRGSTVTGNMSRNDGSERQGDLSCAFLLENCEGITLTGNTVWCWPHRERNEKTHVPDGSPWYGIVARNLTECVISQNALNQAASREILRDYGGHKNSIVAGNVGSTFALDDTDSLVAAKQFPQ